MEISTSELTLLLLFNIGVATEEEEANEKEDDDDDNEEVDGENLVGLCHLIALEKDLL